MSVGFFSKPCPFAKGPQCKRKLRRLSRRLVISTGNGVFTLAETETYAETDSCTDGIRFHDAALKCYSVTVHLDQTGYVHILSVSVSV